LPLLFTSNGLNLFLPFASHNNIVVPFISLMSQAIGAIFFYRFSFSKINNLGRD